MFSDSKSAISRPDANLSNEKLRNKNIIDMIKLQLLLRIMW